MSEPDPIFAPLFNEELGAVIQLRTADLDHVTGVLRQHGLDSATTHIGTLNDTHTFRIRQAGAGKPLFEENLFALRAIWSDVTRRIVSCVFRRSARSAGLSDDCCGVARPSPPTVSHQ